jgi:hypothetical protein
VAGFDAAASGAHASSRNLLSKEGRARGTADTAWLWQQCMPLQCGRVGLQFTTCSMLLKSSAVTAAATVAKHSRCGLCQCTSVPCPFLCCAAGVSVQYGASSVMSSNGMTIAVSTAASTDSYYKLTYMYRCGSWSLSVCSCRELAEYAGGGCLQAALCGLMLVAAAVQHPHTDGVLLLITILQLLCLIQSAVGCYLPACLLRYNILQERHLHRPVQDRKCHQPWRVLRRQLVGRQGRGPHR